MDTTRLKIKNTNNGTFAWSIGLLNGCYEAYDKNNSELIPELQELEYDEWHEYAVWMDMIATANLHMVDVLMRNWGWYISVAFNEGVKIGRDW